MKLRLTVLTLTCLWLAGCSILLKDSNLVSASYKAADQLIKGIKDIETIEPRRDGVYRPQPILITSIVNIDDLQQSSTFGRLVAEQIGSRVAQRGYKVIEMKVRTGSIFIQERKGEFILSRELREISYQHDAYAVVVGTYAASKESVYVTVKLIRANDNVILSSYDYRLPVGPGTKQLLNSK
jgi:TolB-like protein